MKFLSIAYYTFLRGIKDWKFILMIVIAPIFIIMLTGTATDSIDKARDKIKTGMAYYSEDKGFISTELKSLLESSAIRESFLVKFVKSKEEGYKSLRERKVDAFVTVEQGTSQVVQSGKKAQISVLSWNEISPTAILIRNFTNKVNAAIIKKKLDVSNSALRNTLQAKANIKNGSNSIFESISLPDTKEAISGVNKWSYLNSLLFIFYGCLIGSLSVIILSKQHVGKRIDTAPLGRFTHTAAMLVGNTLILFIAFTIIAAFSGFFLGANWGNNIPLLILVFLLYSIICSGLGSLIGSITKNTAVSSIVIVGLNIMLGSGAVMYSNGLDTGAWRYLYPISPQYHSYSAITSLIYHGNRESFSQSILYIVFIGFILTVSAIFAGRRKQL